jgi:hypothetical protein
MPSAGKANFATCVFFAYGVNDAAPGVRGALMEKQGGPARGIDHD